MIARLRGTIAELGEGWVILDVGGVGYHLQVSPRVRAALPGVGHAVVLAVDTVVREDSISLFGFLNAAEREWFRLLGTVQGVGAKAAMAILSVAPPDLLRRAVLAGDPAPVRKAAGVGPKIASRVVAELKEKAALMPVGADPIATVDQGDGAAPQPPAAEAVQAAIPVAGSVPGKGQAQAEEEAVSALVNLGYGRVDAHRAVIEVLSGDQADPASQTTSTVIAAALKALGRGLLDQQIRGTDG